MRKLKHGKMSGGCGDSCCLKLEGLNVRIQGEEILEDVSFHLHCGEITALIGNVSTKDGELYLHIHATLGDDKGLAHGGHLNEAVVSATCELFIRKLDMVIERKADPKTGINLMVF